MNNKQTGFHACPSVIRFIVLRYMLLAVYISSQRPKGARLNFFFKRYGSFPVIGKKKGVSLPYTPFHTLIYPPCFEFVRLKITVQFASRTCNSR